MSGVLNVGVCERRGGERRTIPYGWVGVYHRIDTIETLMIIIGTTMLTLVIRPLLEILERIDWLLEYLIIDNHLHHNNVGSSHPATA